MQFESYQRNVGDQFFPEFLAFCTILTHDDEIHPRSSAHTKPATYNVQTYISPVPTRLSTSGSKSHKGIAELCLIGKYLNNAHHIFKSGITHIFNCKVKRSFNLNRTW
jgi:hypothetical protein